MARADDIALVWFRRDLRLDHNPAWAAATNDCEFAVALYVLDDRDLASVGPFRRRQLVANLQAFDYDLFERTRGRLVVRTGDPRDLVPDTAERLGCTAVYWNGDVSTYAAQRDAQVEERLEVPVHTTWGDLVVPPGSVTTKKGHLPKVFSAFHRNWKATTWEEHPEPGEAVVYPEPAELIPRLDAPAPIPEGEDEATRRLADLVELADTFDENVLSPASEMADRVAVDLYFGLLSPRMVYLAIGDETPGRIALQRRLARRDWFAHVLADHSGDPRIGEGAEAAGMNGEAPPQDGAASLAADAGLLAAWKGGFTGYPIVDAAMRQLRETGWLPERLRVVVASFLVRHLRIDWRLGERHLAYLLVDGDEAQNLGLWRSVAGEGRDPMARGRFIDPVEESRRVDPEGDYLVRWVPELYLLSPEHRHAPWRVEATDLAAAGIVLGDSYPRPVVDHSEARERWLADPEPADAEVTTAQG